MAAKVRFQFLAERAVRQPVAVDHLVQIFFFFGSHLANARRNGDFDFFFIQ